MVISIAAVTKLVASVAGLSATVGSLLVQLKDWMTRKSEDKPAKVDQLETAIQKQTEILVKTQEQIEVLRGALEATTGALLRLRLLAVGGLIIGTTALALAILK